MGEDNEEMPSSTNIAEENWKKYDAVISNFDAVFKVRKNVIFERARFNQRSQKPGESAKQFITFLYSLAENCAYGDLKNKIIRDHIVVDIHDETLP